MAQSVGKNYVVYSILLILEEIINQNPYFISLLLALWYSSQHKLRNNYCKDRFFHYSYKPFSTFGNKILGIKTFLI